MDKISELFENFLNNSFEYLKEFPVDDQFEKRVIQENEKYLFSKQYIYEIFHIIDDLKSSGASTNIQICLTRLYNNHINKINNTFGINFQP